MCLSLSQRDKGQQKVEGLTEVLDLTKEVIREEKTIHMQVNYTQRESLSNKIALFYSYAQADRKLRDQLARHLSPLALNDERLILAGELESQKNDLLLEEADFILLLLSSEYLNSERCKREMQCALQRREQDEVRLIPIILRPCLWESTPLAHFSCLPENRQPVTDWRNRDKAFFEIARHLYRLIGFYNDHPFARSL